MRTSNAKPLLLVVGLTTIVSLFVIRPKWSPQVQPMTQSEQATPARASSPKKVGTAPALPTALPPAATPALADLRKAVEASERHARLDARKQAFRDSGLDTNETFAAAVAALERPYAASLSESDVGQRVIAIHTMGLSSHATMKDCEHVLDQMQVQYKAAGEDQRLRRALQWDTLALTKICHRIDEDGTKAYVTDLGIPALRRQAELGLGQEVSAL